MAVYDRYARGGAGLVTVGEALKFADPISFKEDIKIFKNNLATVVFRRGVKVMLNTEATPGLVTRLNPDRLIVAIGAEPIIPLIPGYFSVIAGWTYGTRRFNMESVMMVS